MRLYRDTARRARSRALRQGAGRCDTERARRLAREARGQTREARRRTRGARRRTCGVCDTGARCAPGRAAGLWAVHLVHSAYF